MISSIIISVITCITLIFCIIEIPYFKIKGITLESFWIIAVIGAIFILCTKSLPFDYLIDNLSQNTSINPLKIILLLLSLTMLSITLDELDFFEYIAYKAVHYVKGSQYKLFFVLYFLIAFLTIFTSNDIVILTFTQFICYLSKNAKINPIPYLVMEFVTANTYSMFFIIGNPTNIYIANAFELTFFEYFKVMALPTLTAGIISLICLLLMFKKQLSTNIDISHLHHPAIKYKKLAIINTIHLMLCTCLLAISNYIHIEMWFITILFALSLTLFLFAFSIINKNFVVIKKVFKRLPYTLCIFVLSMYIIVLSLDYHSLNKNIADWISSITSNKFALTYIYGFSSAICDNLINNIPMSLNFTSILFNVTENNLCCIYSTIIGSNIGAFITPIGALAGIMWMRILKEQEVDFTFKSFILNCGRIALPVLIGSLTVLAFIL